MAGMDNPVVPSTWGAYLTRGKDPHEGIPGLGWSADLVQIQIAAVELDQLDPVDSAALIAELLAEFAREAIHHRAFLLQEGIMGCTGPTRCTASAQYSGLMSMPMY